MVFQFCQMCSCCWFIWKKKRDVLLVFFHNFSFPIFLREKGKKFCPPVFLITLRIFASIPEPSPYTFPKKGEKKIKKIKKSDLTKKKLTLSVLNILAISGTKGSSGLGSQSKEQIDNNTVTKVKKMNLE